MPRVRTRTLEKRKASSVEDDFAALADKPTQKRSATGLARQIRETKEMMKSDDWSKAKASHLVALYSVLHEMVYGVAPELKGDDLKQAKMAAGLFLKTKCGGSVPKAVEFLKWVWKKEKGTEKWRRENQVDGKVMGWPLMFRYPSLWTSYKVGQERRRHG